MFDVMDLNGNGIIDKFEMMEFCRMSAYPTHADLHAPQPSLYHCHRP